jgi:polyhydroxybutyrate depolymerase
MALAFAAGCVGSGGDDGAATTTPAPVTDPSGTDGTGDEEPPALASLTALAPAVLDPHVASAATSVGELVDGVIETPDGRSRSYHLYVPSSLPEGEVPLLVGLHGGLGSGMQFATSSELTGLAEANGFLAVFPDGIPIRNEPDRAVWNGGGCCATAAEDREDVDDVAFVGELIDTVAASYPVDPERVVVTGHSNGGILSMRLACELEPRVAAVAFQAGTLFVPGCDNDAPVSALAIHGADDRNVLLDGGAGDASLDGSDYPPVRDGLAALAAANGCTGGAEPEVAPAVGQVDVTVETWTGCPDGIDVQLLVVAGANHAWMGHGQAGLSERRIGPAYRDLDASEVVWSFLAAHPRVTP